MDQLWTPWRMEYIRSASVEEQPDCIFCALPEGEEDEANLILVRSGKSFVILNRFPYNPGHLMVVPFRHVGAFEELDDDELLDMQRLLQRSVAALNEEMQPHGFNLGANLGRIAGAGIPDHLHWHVVPRWGGDTNFMPVVGQTKVLPELLAETYAKLLARF